MTFDQIYCLGWERKELAGLTGIKKTDPKSLKNVELKEGSMYGPKGMTLLQTLKWEKEQAALQEKRRDRRKRRRRRREKA